METLSTLVHRTLRHYDQEALLYVKNLVTSALLECCSVEEFKELQQTDSVNCIAEKSYEDLLVFSQKDPAAGGDPLYIAKNYTSYAAVLHYRVAHWVHMNHRPNACHSAAQSLAASISRRGKMLSGAEIDFRSRIGSRFVIDHGVGTVIGETTVIGNDCYILGGVTLGARGISSNGAVPRHPRIGNHVQIGAFANLLGNVSVGDGAFIGPGCVITRDVPSGARVQVKTSLQVQLPE